MDWVAFGFVQVLVFAKVKSWIDSRCSFEVCEHVVWMVLMDDVFVFSRGLIVS
jgi:hypothetical protein